jgi:hypothetical protein
LNMPLRDPFSELNLKHVGVGNDRRAHAAG